MKRRPYIVHKPKPNEIELYSRVEIEFIVAISNMNTKLLMNLLAKDGIYFNRMKKYKAINFLHEHFKLSLKNELEVTEVRNFTALGFHAGKRCISFILSNGCFFPRISPIAEDERFAFVIDVNTDSSLIQSIHLVNDFTSQNDFNDLSKHN